MDRSLSDMSHQSKILGASLTEFSVGVGTMLTTGFVAWVVRGGALMSAFITSMPAWRGFDPLIIVNDRKQDDKDDDESDTKVDRMFESSSSIKKRYLGE